MKHLLSYIAMPVLACCFVLSGCRSEPELISSNEVSAREPASADKRTNITSVRSPGAPAIRGGLSGGSVISEPGVPPSEKQTTEPMVVAFGQIKHADGSAASGVSVSLHGFNPQKITAGKLDYGDAIATAESGPEGQYEVSGPTAFGMHLQITGDVPRMQVMLDNQELYTLGKPKPGVQRIKKDITLLESHRVSGTVVDGSGKPMAGLPVHLKPKFTNNDTRLFRSTETTSSASGTFEVNNLSPGTWMIGTVHPDYAPVTEMFDIPATGPITLQIGAMGGKIRGHIYHKDSGAGAGGLPVHLTAGMYAIDTLEKYETKSAADGSFKFDKVSSGPKQIRLELGDNPKLGLALPPPPTLNIGEKETTDVTLFVYPGHTITGRVYDKDIDEPLPGAEISRTGRTAANAEKVVTDSAGQYRIDHVFPIHGAYVGLDVELEGFEPFNESNMGSRNLAVNLTEDELVVTRDFPMVKTVKLSGIVVTKDEMPVPHATVNLYNNRTHSSTNEKTTVNADGTFELHCVPFVSAVIEAEASGFGSVVSDAVELTTKDVDGIKLVMEPGAVVQGRVLSPDGSPVAEASVKQNKQYGIFGSISEATVSGKDGVYTLRDMPKQVELSAKREGFAESEKVEFTVNPGETKTGVDITLREGFSISGKVITADGQPVVKASVHAQGDNIFEHKNADENGAFEIASLAAGTYRVTASGKGGYKTLENIKAGTADLEIVLGSNDPVERGATVKFTGTVLDDASGDPIRDFKVEANVNTIKVKMLPGPGKFELEGVEQRHVYELKIASPDYETQSFRTESSSNGEDLEQTFRLGRSGAITGRVIEKGTGSPVADLVVVNWGNTEYYERQRKGPENHTTTDEQGKFVLAPVPSGKNTVQVKAIEPYSEVAKSIEVSSEEVADMGDIELSRGGSITGTVVQGDNEDPVPNQQVSLSGWSEEMQVSKKAMTDVDGRFEFTGLAAMNYTVNVESVSRSVQLTAEASEDIKIVLGGVTMRGTITRGDELISASISGIGPGGTRVSNYARSGEYTIKNIQPGTYEFTVHPQQGNYSNPLKETIEVPDQEEFVKDFKLPDGGIIVTVINSAGEPVQGAQVSLSQKSSNTGYDQLWLSRTMETKNSNSEGKVEFSGLGSGVYSVSGRKEGVGTAMKPDVQLATDQTANVELQLSSEGGTLVSVALSYTTGQGVQEAWCYLHGEGGPFAHSAKRDASGVMVIENIPPGTYTTNVSYWSHSQSEKQVEIKANETAQIEDVLYPAGALHWILKKADGSGAAGATVTVTPVTTDPPEEQRTGQTNSTGLFLQRGLAAGTYQVTAQLPGKPAVTETFTIAAGVNEQKELTVPSW